MMDSAAAKSALLDLHKEFLPRAYRRTGAITVIPSGEMQRLCDVILDGVLVIEGLRQQVVALQRGYYKNIIREPFEAQARKHVLRSTFANDAINAMTPLELLKAISDALEEMNHQSAESARDEADPAYSRVDKGCCSQAWERDNQKP